MNITRKSPFSGRENTLDLDITAAQIQDYQNGALLQDAFPHLTADEREFYKTGITEAEWEELFGSEE